MLLQGQEGYRTGLEGFYVPERHNLNIGFGSFDLHCPSFSGSNYSLDLGLRFIGAATGRRGGYFAFGYFSELLLLPAKKLQPGFSLAFLGGGGAAAPDYDGWMGQGTVFMRHVTRKGLGIKAGLNYTYVSGGAIAGFSPLAGLLWNIKTGGGADSVTSLAFVWEAVYGETGIGASGEGEVAFVGAGAKCSFGKHLAGDVMIHALANAHGGYMQSLLSAGPKLAIGPFFLSPALVLGMGGGGGVGTKGGGLYGGQAGLYFTGATWHTGLRYQVINAFSRQFAYKAMFLSFGKSITGGDDFSLPFEAVFKAYAGDNGFGNLGARFKALRYRGFALCGSTYWAFTHGRGAYAEGLFEGTLNAPAQLPFYLVLSAGVGAGSGINQRSASVIFAGGAGLASPWQPLPLSLECAYWAGGNIPHWGLSLLYSFGKKME
jgi:hypothetical protein